MSSGWRFATGRDDFVCGCRRDLRGVLPQRRRVPGPSWPLGLLPSIVLPHLPPAVDLVGEHPDSLVGGPPGTVPDMRGPDLHPLSAGGAVHRGHLRSGHVGLARHRWPRGLLHPGRIGPSGQPHRVRRTTSTAVDRRHRHRQGARYSWSSEPDGTTTGTSSWARSSGPVVAIVIFAVLRWRDPDCLDPRSLRPVRPVDRRMLGRRARPRAGDRRRGVLDRHLFRVHGGSLDLTRQSAASGTRVGSPTTTSRHPSSQPRWYRPSASPWLASLIARG